MRKTFITEKQKLALELDIYTMLMKSDSMGMGKMNECGEAAKDMVENWMSSNDIEQKESDIPVTQKTLKSKWVIGTNTLCQGEIIGCWTEEDGKDVPCIFETEEDAWKEIADDMITMLQQFKDGERSIEDTDFSPSDYPLEVMIDGDGNVYDKYDKILFDTIIGRP